MCGVFATTLLYGAVYGIIALPWYVCACYKQLLGAGGNKFLIFAQNVFEKRKA